MSTYYSIITNNGLIKHADVANNGVNLDLTQMAVGDSNGSYHNPDGSELALQNELYRTNLTHIVIDENNPNQLIIEAVLSENIGPFYIREVGIFDSDGDLFAIGKLPETFKPNLPSGSGKRLYIRIILGFASTPNVNLVINNDIALDPNFNTNINNALDGKLVKTNNLSDLNDVTIARNNLNLQSGAITDLIGCILPFAMEIPPNGWLECDGSQISRTTYDNLFAKINTTYGAGDNTTTFNLPDLRGEFIRGWDHNRGIDSSRSFATLQLDDFKSHSHNFIGDTRTGAEGNDAIVENGRSPYYSDTNAVQPTGGSETRPRNIALIYCIKY